MVRALGPPSRPLPKTGDKTVWWWNPPQASARWWWCRVYHQCKYTPDGVTFRQYGPAARFDHHHPADPSVVDTTGRRILYVGEDLATSACEVFGDAGIAAICPNYRVAIIAPTTKLVMYDLAAEGAAMAIGALPALSDGNEARSLTQQWARRYLRRSTRRARNHRHSSPLGLQQRRVAGALGLRCRRRSRA
jgi:hypothetical protein